MGFFDKLFGRTKDVSEDVGQTAEEYGGKAVDTAQDVGDKGMDTAGDVGQKGEEAFDTAKDKVTGGGEGGGGGQGGGAPQS